MSSGGGEQTLLDRYFESVLERYLDGRYDLLTARLELTAALGLSLKNQKAFREHLQTIVEAGDEA